ncbi:MAG: hypothetical protein DLM62_14620 [Pseudonocardiales bacterium]|nr:MAG: hypothetical protein DLM62_14620 [Pseudonocardiales bacterium]
MLGIYLNDHLAGLTVEVELARRAKGAQQGSEIGAALGRLTAEIVGDRAALRDMMASLGVPVRRYKAYAAWVGEKVGRMKPNGYVRGRSPLSLVVELEALRLTVEHTALGWRTLRELAHHDGRLDIGRLDGLLDRGRRQADTLEELRARQVAEVFGTAGVHSVA